MALPFTEDFAGGAAVLGNPPWTQAALDATTLNKDGGGFGKASAATSQDILAYDNSNSYSNDQYAQVVIQGGISVALGDYAEVIVRASGSAGTFACYQLLTNGGSGAGNTELWKYSGGTGTLLTNFVITFAAADVMKIDVVGSLITVYKNGVSFGTFSDGSITSGAPGCGVFNSPVNGNNVTIDNFQSDNVTAVAAPISWPVGTWRPIGTPGPRDPLGFLIPGPRSYIESITVLPPTVVPKPPVIVSKPKRRKRTVTVTTLSAKVSRLTTVKPRAPITVVARPKQKRRKPRATLIRGAPRASAAPTSVRPAKTITVVTQTRHRTRKAKTSLVKGATRRYAAPPRPTIATPRKRRKRAGSVSLLRAPRAAPVVATAPRKPVTVAIPRKRRRRLGAVSLLVAPLTTTVVTSVPPRKPATIATPRKRRKRAGAVTTLAAKVSRLPTGKPPKQTIILVERRRAGKKGKVTRVSGATRAPVAPSVAPRKSITVKLVPKRRARGGKAKQTLLRKPRTPYITGVTRNSAGTPIGSCNVFVFRTANDTLVAQGVSDSVTGIYLLPVPSYTDNLFVVAYRADAPDIFGTTVNWLTGV